MVSEQTKAWDTMYRKPVEKALKKSRIELKRDKSIILSERDVEFCVYSHLKKEIFDKCTVNAGVSLFRKKGRSFPDIIIIPRNNLRLVGRRRVKIMDFNRAFCVQIKLSETHIPHEALCDDWNKAIELGFQRDNIMIFLAKLVDPQEHASTEKEYLEYIRNLSRIPSRYHKNIYLAHKKAEIKNR